MSVLDNQYYGASEKISVPENVPLPSTNADAPIGLLAQCPAYLKTPLVPLHDLALEAGISRLYVKDETGRMGLGSFKALGAAYVIAHHAVQTGIDPLSKALVGQTYVTASAGNHGLSVAAGAAIFGAKSIIYLAETVPAAFADRLREKGAEVRVEGAEYEASMMAAQNAANDEGLILLSDSSWDGYTELPHRLMEGYLASGKEITDEMNEIPTHIFLQAGVGGLAGAMAAWFRAQWGDVPKIVVVEPESAPALHGSIKAGKSVVTEGPVSNMGRLDCKEPSLIALKGLAEDANYFQLISDQAAEDAARQLASHDILTTPSGVAGLCGLLDAQSVPSLGLNESSVALCIISEGVES